MHQFPKEKRVEILTRLNTTKAIEIICYVGGILATIVVNPWTNYDPINLPKMVVLVTFGFFLFPLAVSKLKHTSNVRKFVVPVYVLLPIALLVSFVSNPEPKIEKIWGAWGRNTGIITILCLYFFMFALSTISDHVDLRTFQRFFHRLGYFITTYSLMQMGQLDPIPWSQKLPFATLGNINFMSAFLGFSSISMIIAAYFSKSLSSKIFFVLASTLNMFIVLKSGSVQGFVMFLAGATIFTLMILWKNKKFLLVKITVCFLIPTGLVTGLGVFGIGPLGNSLVQETMKFRIDYWLAATAMTISRPLTGIGVDSYGDFYREFRNIVAAERTGPSRVSNTAHNIFLDLSSGAGVIAGISLLALFVMAISILILRFKKGLANDADYTLLPLIIAFLIFCLISINQIGVTIWGFIFLGWTLGLSTGGRLQKNKEFAGDKWKDQTSFVLATSLLFGIFGLIISSLPVRADATFLTLFRTPSSNSFVYNNSSFTTFHREKLTEKMITSGSIDSGVLMARNLLKFNERSYYAWSVLAFSGGGTIDEQMEAKRRLMELDPQNMSLQIELSGLGGD